MSTRLIHRARHILFAPDAEWDVIEPEAATVPRLYLGYACILAAILAAAKVLGELLIMRGCSSRCTWDQPSSSASDWSRR